MSGKSEELKGRAKEALGVVTDDASLKREGQLDQLAGEAKQVAEKAVDSVKRAARKLEDAVKRK